MKWLRSQEMEYISLILNEDAAHDCVQKLGVLGVMEFMDLNPELTPFQRRYVSSVKRCDEMERKLRYFETEVEKLNIPVKSAGFIDHFLAGSASIRYGSQDTAIKALDTMERILEDKEQELVSLNTIHEKLTKEYNERKELEQILERIEDFFEIDLPDVSNYRGSRTSSFNLAAIASSTSFFNGSNPASVGGKHGKKLNEDDLFDGSVSANQASALRFCNVTGVVPADERLRFERMIFRTTRGNCLMRFSPIEELLIDPTSGKPVEKQAFVVFFQSKFIETKIRKICDAFHARLYTLPNMDDREAIANLIQTNLAELSQSAHILSKNRESCVLLCREIAENLESWKWSVLQEKATYHTLNLFRSDVSGMLRAGGWVIKDAFESVRREVTLSHHSDDKSMPCLVDQIAKPWPTAPTFFETNKCTEAFQSFVDTYGVPRYREINPAVFTTITFPFLFGVMYGDIGHGLCVTLFGLYLIMTEKKMEKPGALSEIALQIYGGRYMLFLMGLFAIYAGFIYNDFFSLSLNLFGSRYTYDPHCLEKLEANEHDNIRCEGKYVSQGSDLLNVTSANVATGWNVYSFGLDPIWKTSENELLFFNSFKMKLSVVLGIIQMTFGILLKGCNAIAFGEFAVFFFEFIPQLVFCSAFFMYMVVLILMKWRINWSERMSYETCPYNFTGPQTGCRPPSLINTLINIALDPFHVTDPMYDGQLKTQQFLLTCAFLAVPAMLFLKPLYMRFKHRAQTVLHEDFEEEDEKEVSRQQLMSGEHPASSHGSHGEENHAFGEVMIHQSIETIEFVLGMVSNTASYLRLWALSLAHSELATVFWEKAMMSAINMDSFIAIFIGFGAFAGVTLGVILAMDVLECFLHALRLHWVEFQSKFYKADGYKFAPFSFKQVIKDSQVK